jgi:hypothetical protein
MIRPLAPLLAASLLAACGGREDDATARANSVEELSNRLDKLSDRTTEDIEPPDRLGSLLEADVGPELRAGPGCRLQSDGSMAAESRSPSPGRSGRPAASSPPGV